MSTNINIKSQAIVNQFVNTILNNTNLAVKQYLDPENHRALFNASKLTDKQKAILMGDYQTPHIIKSDSAKKLLKFDILWLTSEIHEFNNPEYEFYDETGRSQREDESKLKLVKSLLNIASKHPNYYWFTRHNLLDFSLKINNNNFDSYQFATIHLIDDKFMVVIKRAIINNYRHNLKKLKLLVHNCLSSNERQIITSLLMKQDSRVDTQIGKRFGLIK